MPEDTIFFSLLPTQRGTGTGDRRAVNVISEVVNNPLTKEAYYSTIKRPGLPIFRTPATSATGRGVFGWRKTGKLYSVSGTQLVSSTLNGSTTLASLASSSGRVWFTETPETASTQVLVVSDGLDDYFINSNDVTVQIDESDDGQFPTPNLGPVEFFSNYLVHATTAGIVNTDLNNFTAYTAGSTLSAGAIADSLEAIKIQRDQIVMFGQRSIEFAFDNGNPTGSPFLPIDQNRLSFGLAAKESLAWSGDLAIFVGENSANGDGGRSVWLLQAGSVKEISDSVINRFLAAEGTSISSCTAWMERIAGQLLYVLNLSSAGRSFVYNVNAGQWDGEFTHAGSALRMASATSLDGTIYLQRALTGIIYRVNPTIFVDDGSLFPEVILQTEGRDQGTSNRKSVRYIELQADTQSSGSATLAASDDDFTTFTNIGIFDLTKEQKRINRGGSYKGKRAWRLNYSGNTAFRAKALRIVYDVGRI